MDSFGKKVNIWNSFERLSLITAICALGISCGTPKLDTPVRSIPGKSLVSFTEPLKQVQMEAFIKGSLDKETASIVNVQIGDGGLSLSGEEIGNSKDVRFDINGVPFCTLGARAHELKDGSFLLLGRQPEFSSSDNTRSFDFPAIEDAKITVKNNLPVQSFLEPKSDDVAFYEIEKCIFNASYDKQKPSLIPAYRMHIVYQELPYFFIATDSEVLLQEERYFNVKGKAKIYDTNPFDSKFVELEMEGFTGAGTLDTEFFTTQVFGGESRIRNENHDFTVDAGAPGFAEVHLFFNALRQYKFYEDLGFQWYGPKPLVINVHSNNGSMINNGLYKPGGQPGVPQPSILIGDGDGVTLQNLAFDADVVSHEVNHHMVFKRLKSTSGQSLILHEGLADYFTFARTGNACLGESICPNTDQSICYRPKQCLRTAENTLVLNNEEYRQFGSAEHLKSQMISGFLWDIRKDASTVDTEIDNLAFRSVDLLFQTSGFQDLVVAVLKADQENGSKYFDLIKAKAEARGLGTYIEGIQKGGQLPAIEGVKESTSSVSTAPPSTVKSSNSKSGGGGGGCTVGGVSHSSPLFLILLLLSFVPRFMRNR